MTFTVVDQLKRRLQDKEIYLFSQRDFDRDEKEKNIYNFNILPWDLKTKLSLLSPGNKDSKSIDKYAHLIENIEEVILGTDFIIDISGYALSSQWGWLRSINYLLNIIIAKHYSIPYYIFPQSIGPFNYPLKYKLFLYPLIKLYLNYPKKIFPREIEGIKSVNKFTTRNVEKRHDIVLQNTDYNLKNIFKTETKIKKINIDKNSVGIIPNTQVIKRINSEEIYSIYNSIIKKALKAEKNIYILRHSFEDLIICKKNPNPESFLMTRTIINFASP